MTRRAASTVTSQSVNDELVLTRQQFREAPMHALTSAKSLKIKNGGEVKWILITPERYDHLMTKLAQLP